MSRLNDLIQELCPDGVEFQKLGELFDISNTGVDKKIVEDQKEIKLLNYTDIYKKIYIDKNDVSMIVTASDNKISSCSIKKGDLYITPTSEVKNDIGHAAVIIGDIDDCVYSYHIMRLRVREYINTIMPEFVMYLFNSDILQVQINKVATGLTRYGVSKRKVELMQIPVPPLEVQKEIVRILDTFTELTEELTEELTARKKQYAYYRNMLLDFVSENVKYKKLSEICIINAGGDIPKNFVKGQKNPTSDNKYPIYSNGIGENALYGYTDSYKITNRSITISARGTVGWHTIRNPFFTPVVRLITLQILDENMVDIEYLNYALDVIDISNSGGSIPQITVPKIKCIEVPLPNLEIQKKIAGILNKFAELTFDLNQGLPKEIELINKQYEHYRDKLLYFDRI